MTKSLRHPATWPSLVVFDLDFTLWDCGGTWVDCTQPPYHRIDGRVLDRRGRHLRLYPEVVTILDELDAEGVPLALASRTEAPAWAGRVLDLMQLRHRFAFEEIYPSSKLRHFAALRDTTGISYQEMLFFDDESRNIHEVSTLGVTCVLVRNGLDLASFQDGLDAFTSDRQAAP